MLGELSPRLQIGERFFPLPVIVDNLEAARPSFAPVTDGIHLWQRDFERMNQIHRALCTGSSGAEERQHQPQLLVQCWPLLAQHRDRGGVAGFADEYTRPWALLDRLQAFARRGWRIARGGACQNLGARPALHGLVGPGLGFVHAGVQHEFHVLAFQAVQRQGRKQASRRSPVANLGIGGVSLPNFQGRAKFVIGFLRLWNLSGRQVGIYLIARADGETAGTGLASVIEAGTNPHRLDIDQGYGLLVAGIVASPATGTQAPVNHILKSLNLSCHKAMPSQLAARAG